jgi:hypothetical protein
MELKQAGDLLVTLSAMEQELQSTCLNCDPQDMTTAKDLLLADQIRLVKSILALTNS